MGYSSNKPYQRSTYRTGTDPNYDRFLKEGKAVTEKESVLEKPYKSSNYNSMQQDYNMPIPPTLDPGSGTGLLNCVWIDNDCEQLVGCWAGSEIELNGDEAETAGYQLPLVVTEGEVVKTVIGGSENRGITIHLNPLMTRNSFEVTFKAGDGQLFTEKMEITCATGTNTIECYVMDTSENGTWRWLISDGYYEVKEANVVKMNLNDGTHRRDAVFSFQTITCPTGTTISNSYFEFYAKSSHTNFPIETARIYVNDDDDDIDVLFGSASLTEYVTWTFSEYNAAVNIGDKFTTPDVTALVQRIIDRVGFTCGNGITFFIVPQTGTNEEVALQEFGGAYISTLHITADQVIC